MLHKPGFMYLGRRNTSLLLSPHASSSLTGLNNDDDDADVGLDEDDDDEIDDEEARGVEAVDETEPNNEVDECENVEER